MIRLMFTFAVICNLVSVFLDFTQVFLQADIKGDVFIEIPFGYENLNNEYVLKLKKNFYGLCDANLT